MPPTIEEVKVKDAYGDHVTVRRNLYGGAPANVLLKCFDDDDTMIFDFTPKQAKQLRKAIKKAGK